MSVLVLSQSYMPIGTVSWQDAVTLWYTKKAEIIQGLEGKLLHSGTNSEGDSTTMAKPSIVRLLHFVRPKKKLSVFQSLSRRNVYERDKGICQYCGEHVSFSKFTYDHVVPRANGGTTNWKNIVCSCHSCNNKKGSKSLQDCGMMLIKPPLAPLICDNFDVMNVLKMKKVKVPDPTWNQYFYWQKQRDDNK